MAKVVAKARGYFGGLIREAGETFDWPNDLPAPKWTRPFAFGGKGDHDGDGKTGGSKPAEHTLPAGPVVVPADWKSGKAADRKALAKAITGEVVTNAADADRVIEKYVETTAPEPFSDAPAPEVAKDNGITEALGGVQPDWVAPGTDI